MRSLRVSLFHTSTLTSLWKWNDSKIQKTRKERLLRSSVERRSTLASLSTLLTQFLTASILRKIKGIRSFSRSITVQQDFKQTHGLMNKAEKFYCICQSDFYLQVSPLLLFNRLVVQEELSDLFHFPVKPISQKFPADFLC